MKSVAPFRRLEHVFGSDRPAVIEHGRPTQHVRPERAERKAYCDMLESTLTGDLNVTPWLEWFLGCLDRAFSGAETILAAVLEKAEFRKRHPPPGSMIASATC